MQLVIDRTKWARGGINGSSMLLNDEGNMCCLGFAAIAVGLSEDDIIDVGEFEELHADSHIELIDGLDFNPFCTIGDSGNDDNPRIYNTEFHDEAVKINDFVPDRPRSEYYTGPVIETEEQRELVLIELFLKAGIDLSFEN